MKRISPKIMVAGITAGLLVVVSIILVHKQSLAVTDMQAGTLSPSNYVPTESSSSQNNLSASTTGSSTPLTQTDILSKQVFSNFMTLQQSGNLNNQTVQSLTDQLSSQIIDNQPSAQEYTSADLKIISNPTNNDIKNYGNQLFALRNKYQNDYIRGAISPDSPYIDSSQSGMMRVFSSMETLYSGIVTDLLKMAVPAGLVNLHLQLINIYSASAFGLQQFGQLDTDPVAAISGLNVYNQNSDQENAITQKIADYFVNNGIIFSVNDPGYGWNSI